MEALDGSEQVAAGFGACRIDEVMDALFTARLGYLHTEIATEALTMEIKRQRPSPGLIHHSDRGIHYGAETYRHALLNQASQRP